MTMLDSAGIEAHDEVGGLRVVPYGSWTVEQLLLLQRGVSALPSAPAAIMLDLAHLAALDTAGAWLLVRECERWRKAGIGVEWANVTPAQRTLIDEVDQHKSEQTLPPLPEAWPIRLLEDTGTAVEDAGRDAVRVTGFFGAVVSAFATVFTKPWRFRFTSFVHHLEHTGLRAVPIIALMSFLIGGIIAQQGAFQLRKFGAELFVVDLVGILVLREIGMLMAAIMFAGRSGSAFTAEIGSMKMREEIDALRIIGLDPVETLVLPRLAALIVALPAVTFISDLMCLFGSGVVLKFYMGISPDTYMSRLREAVSVHTFLIGILKAPFMALVIGLIACVEGLKVKGSAESLGLHTTSSVVKAIFVVIVLDGFFAVFFAAINW